MPTINKLNFLGRGSAFNIKEGNTSAYIKKHDSMLLIDCGETVFSTIIEKSLLEGINDLTIAVTHLHPDHVGSLGSLLFYCKYIKKITPTVIYPDYHIIDMLKLQGASDEYNISHGSLEGIDKLDIKSIEAHESSHVEEIKSFSYKITFLDDYYFYYTGDTNNADSICSMLKDKNCIAIYTDTCLIDYDGNVHLPLKKLCELVPKDLRYKVFCMHLDSDGLADKCIEEGFNIVETIKLNV